MADWYCLVDGAQHGPVDEATFRRWISEGRVTDASYVWTEGMPDWAPLSTVSHLVGERVSAAGVPAVAAFARGPTPGGREPRGTSGRSSNGDIAARARRLLSGRWGLAIGFCLLLALLQQAAAMLPYVGGLASLVLTGPFRLGSAIFFLTLSRHGDPKIEMLFVGFRNFGRAVGVHLLVALFVALWSIPAAVPGVLILIGALTVGNGEQPTLVFLGIIVIMIPTVVRSHWRVSEGPDESGDGSVPLDLRRWLLGRIDEINETYRRFFQHFNELTGRSKSAPAWTASGDDPDRLSWTLSRPYWESALLTESTRSLIQDLEGMLLGKPYAVSYTNGVLAVVPRVSDDTP
jgi:hypothetical protein